MNKFDSLKHERFASVGWCEKYAYEAKQAKLWINIGHEWFSPDEFIKYARANTQPYFKDLTSFRINEFKMKDPREVIPRMEKRLQEITKIHDEFIRRVNEYYKK